MDKGTALRAIIARIDGEWDNPALLQFGPMTHCTNTDIIYIANKGLEADG